MIDGFLGAVPAFFRIVSRLRRAWRRALEDVDVTILPPDMTVFPPGRRPSPTIQHLPDASTLIWARLRVRIINDRHTPRLRIIGATLAVKRRHWWLWKRTVLAVPVVDATTRQPPDYVLGPRGQPLVVDLIATGRAVVQDFSERWESMLIMETVGAPRRIARWVDDQR